MLFIVVKKQQNFVQSSSDIFKSLHFHDNTFLYCWEAILSVWLVNQMLNPTTHMEITIKH